MYAWMNMVDIDRRCLGGTHRNKCRKYGLSVEKSVLGGGFGLL
jgi:hypothetical protein